MFGHMFARQTNVRNGWKKFQQTWKWTHALGKCKNNRMPGEDGFVAEALKYGGAKLREQVVRIVQKMWEKAGSCEDGLEATEWPDEWKVGLVVPLWKMATGMTKLHGETSLYCQWDPNLWPVLSPLGYPLGPKNGWVKNSQDSDEGEARTMHCKWSDGSSKTCRDCEAKT